MTEAQVFQCPSCGGPLSLSEDSPSIRCEYCSNTIVVPAALRKDSGVVPKEMRRVESFLSAQDAGNVRLLVANGKKIEAIRLLRSLTDLSLKDAKEIADAIERGDPVGPIHNRSSYNESALTEERWAQILTSIQQGRTIEAIRLVREIADVSLHDAKILVETIHSNPGGIDISYHNASFLLEAISRGESQEYTQQRLQAIQVTQAYEQVPTNQPAQVTFTKANPKILGIGI